MANKRDDRSTYREAGVDIDQADKFKRAIAPLARATSRRGITPQLGGFAAAIDPIGLGYHDPVFFVTTDGVGTKLALALEAGCLEGLGIDLVAMCVNDLIACGAEPVAMLDYYACGKLAIDTGTRIVAGIADGCRQAGCALVGGETAQMPGLYKADEFDLAGFAIGVAERGAIWTTQTQRVGDIIIGLPSAGFHANGYSLIRDIISRHGVLVGDIGSFSRPGCKHSLIEELLRPTKIYVHPILKLLRAMPDSIRGIAHITGGGLPGNVPRVLACGLDAEIDPKSWPFPELFAWLAQTGGLDANTMLTTFNCGIGLALLVAQESADQVISALAELGEDAYRIGQLTQAATPSTPAGLRVTDFPDDWLNPAT